MGDVTVTDNVKGAVDKFLQQKFTTVAIAGGSVPQFVTVADSWTVFVADERCVPVSDTQSNSRIIKHAIVPKYLDDPLKAATEYSKIAPSVFDLCILGMGPDGHVCSIFPGRPYEKGIYVAVLDSPKPPMQRITLTMEMLLKARQILFICCGPEKTEILRSVLDGNDSVPAGYLYKNAKNVTWIVDTQALPNLK